MGLMSNWASERWGECEECDREECECEWEREWEWEGDEVEDVGRGGEDAVVVMMGWGSCPACPDEYECW